MLADAVFIFNVTAIVVDSLLAAIAIYFRTRELASILETVLTLFDRKLYSD